MVSYSEAAVFTYLHMFSFSSFTLCFICAFQFLFCVQHREIEWILFWLCIIFYYQANSILCHSDLLYFSFGFYHYYSNYHYTHTNMIIIIHFLLTTFLLQIKLSIRWQFYAFKTLNLVSLFTKKLFCYWHNICFTWNCVCVKISWFTLLVHISISNFTHIVAMKWHWNKRKSNFIIQKLILFANDKEHWHQTI